jgi:hypothetical protein
MNDLSASAALQAAPPSPVSTLGVAGSVFAAAKLLLPHLERGKAVDSGVLRAAMEAARGAARSSPSPRWPSSSRRSRPAASRRWKSWPAT